MRIGVLLVIAMALIAVALGLSLRRNRRAAASSDRPMRNAQAKALPSATTATEDADSIAADISNKLHQLAFGVRTLTLLSPQEHRKVVEATQAALEAVSEDSRYAPRRPLLLPQLMRAVNDTEASRHEVSTIIARDPALAGNLLKLANSAFYRVKAQPIESIDRAVAVLGTEGIRSLIAAAVMQPVFRVSGGAFGQFPQVVWEYTFLAANAAEAHAAAVENTDPFAAQLLGMVMGLGALMVFRAALDQYAAQVEQQPNAAIIASLIDGQCATVARRVAADWELSERILVALEEQDLKGPVHELTSLGRSLRFGRLAAALAVLQKNGLADVEESKAALLSTGTPAAQVERIWAKLTAQ